MGASVEGELHLVMDAIVSYPIQCLLFLSLFLLIFFILCFKGRVEGNYPDLVTKGNKVTQKHFTEMIRLDRDETPFLLSIPLRATTMVW